MKAPAHPQDVLAGLPLLCLRGLRALLVNMPLRESAPPNCAPLGPALLAAQLRARGAAVSILDLNAYRVRDALAEAKGLATGRHLTTAEAEALLARHLAAYGEPHIIGLSGKITTLRWQRLVAAAARALCPHALLVSGGGLATEFREGLFRWVPELDGVAHSEGDDVVVKIGLDALAVHRHGRAVAALAGKLDPYLTGWDRGGALRLVYAGDRPKDLDALPLPAWDLLEQDVDGYPVLEAYIKNPIWGLAANNSSATPFTMDRSLNTVSSRGCPHACNFCFRGAQGERQYGVRAAECLAQEISWLHERFDVSFVGILDDNFMVLPDRINKMIPTVGEVCHRMGVRWGTHGRLDEAADLRPDGRGGGLAARRRVDAMAEAGCVYVGFGAESASPSTLKAMQKGGFMLSNGTEMVNGYNLPRTMLHGYRNTIEAGLHGNCTWIEGYISETLRELQHSVAFIQWQLGVVKNPASVNRRFFRATAYPGTQMYRHPKVKRRLADGFDISFDATGEPICDDALLGYCLQLDDADKVLVDKKGEQVYYGDMPLPLAEKVRGLLNESDLDAVMSL